METHGIGLEPSEGVRGFKARGEVGLGPAAIAEIHGKPRAVLGESRGGTHPGTNLRALAAFGANLKEKVTLHGQVPKGTDHGDLNPIGLGGLLHGEEFAGRIFPQLMPGGEGDQGLGRCFGIRQMAEQPAIRSEPGVQTSYRWRREPRPEGAQDKNHGDGSDQQAPAKPAGKARFATGGRATTAGQWNVSDRSPPARIPTSRARRRSSALGMGGTGRAALAGISAGGSGGHARKRMVGGC